MESSEKNHVNEIRVRYTEPGDANYLKKWFLEPSTVSGFPMQGELEINDAVVRWVSFCRFKCSLTILKNGVPCGIGTLYLQPYRRIVHQCEFGIVVGEEYRGMGIGKCLMNHLLHLAKTKFNIELIHLQVQEGNSAIRFYEKFGFKEFGRQKGWIKNANGLGSRIFMERSL